MAAKVKEALAKDIEQYFPWLSEATGPYLDELPVITSISEFDLRLEITEVIEAFERLILAQFLHNLKPVRNNIIAGDYFYASGIAMLTTKLGSKTAAQACAAMTRSIIGLYSLCQQDHNAGKYDDDLSALILMALRILVHPGARDEDSARFDDRLKAIANKRMHYVVERNRKDNSGTGNTKATF